MMNESLASNQDGLGVDEMNARQCGYLIDSIQRLASARSMADVAETVRKAARQLVDADGATFVLLEGDSVFYVEEDAIGPLWKGQRFAVGSCISGLAIRNGQQIVISDIFADDRVPHDYYRPTFVRSMVMTPVRKSDPIAAIGTYWQHEYEPTPQQRQLLQMLADSTALAIETVLVLSQLEEKVKERTSELKDAHDKALELSQIKSTFVANVSHELRTPLSGIISVAELLNDTGLSGQQCHLLEILQGSAFSLLSLLNDVLDLAKIEAGRVELEKMPVNVMYLLQDATRTMSGSALAKGLVLKASFDYSLPELLMTDSVRIRQILTNLIGNAVKFTASGEVNVRADLVTQTEQEVTIKFEIADTGIGMSKEQVGRLFLPFAQSDTTIARRYGGTGLGLSITKQLVEMMNGTISVTSQIGVGTIFSVTIPFEKTASLPVAKEEIPAQSAGYSIEGVSVLLAEDNRIMQQLTALQLEKLGAKAIVVSNGREAIDQLARQSFDIVLMDCNMPDIDGFEATAMIRENEAKTGKHTPIVALTAAAMAEDVELCLKKGMDSCLTKPVTIAKLQSVIAETIAEIRLHSQSSRGPR